MDHEELAARLERESGGRLAFALHNLESGERLGRRAGEPVPTASVIKLPMLAHIALEAEAGRLDWEARLTLADAVKVPGTGILKQLGAGLALSVRDLCALMTALSDNTATNMLIDLIGVEALNAGFRALGLTQTRLLRRAFSPETPASRPFGLGVTTADEIAGLLARIGRRELGDERAAEAILGMLAMQQDRAAIPRLLPAGWRYAGKTGSGDAMRADAGLLAGPDGRRVALAAFCTGLPAPDWTPDNAGLLAIARLARALLAPEGGS
jgi:beta-lactamase class A